MPASAPSCPVCSDRLYLFGRNGEHAAARICECARTCARCQGRGYVYTTREETFSQKVGPRAYEVIAPCACRELAQRVARLNQAAIPGIHSSSSFEGFTTPSPVHAQAREVALQFAQRYPAERGFILSGPVGTGKTHLLAATLSHVILEGGGLARYVEISFLYQTIRRGFQEGKSGVEIIEPLTSVNLLAIDELGKGRGSPFEMETLDELIARRYNAGRITLFATNYSLQPPQTQQASGYESTSARVEAGRESRLLCDRVGERIYSRIAGMCSFIEFPPGSPDHRRMYQVDPTAAAKARVRRQP